MQHGTRKIHRLQPIERPKSYRLRRRFAWLLFALGLLFLLLHYVLVYINRHTPVPAPWAAGLVAPGTIYVPTLATVLISFLMFHFPIMILNGGIGALIISRRPRNIIGWFLLVVSFEIGVTVFLEQYAILTILTMPGTLPGGVWAAWLVDWIWVPTVTLLLYSLFLFPDGRHFSKRWRLIGISTAVLFVIPASITAAFVKELHDPVYVTNPLYRLQGVQLPATINVAAELVLPFYVFTGVAAALWRYRCAGAETRQQFKWLAVAVVLLFAFTLAFMAGSMFDFLAPLASQFLLVAFSFIPLSFGFAILKYRLYDIDIIINRTLVYTTLTALLALVYVGSVILLQGLYHSLTGQREASQLTIVISTLIIASLFAPLRRRIQTFIDRGFYRHRYDAQRTLERFGLAVRDEVDLGQLTAELLAVVEETMQPASVTIWLREVEVAGDSHAVGREAFRSNQQQTVVNLAFSTGLPGAETDRFMPS